MDVFELTPEARSFWRAAAIQAARELGVFAGRVEPGVSQARLRRLMDVLALEGATGDSGEGAPSKIAEVIRSDRPLAATESLDADDIAAVLEEALDLPTSTPIHPDDVHALLLYHGSSFAISAALSRFALLLQGGLLPRKDSSGTRRGMSARELASREAAKLPLKDAVRPWLPDALLDRPKMGFAMPLPEWLKDSPVAGRMRGIDAAGPVGELLDTARIERLATAHAEGAGNFTNILHAAFALENWFAKWQAA